MARANYQNKTIKRIVFDLNRNTDGDILAFFETISNRQGLLKQLVRQEMARQNFIYNNNKKKGEFKSSVISYGS